MASITRLLLPPLLLLCTTISVTNAAEDGLLTPLCGDCWCIYTVDGLDECPTDTTGIQDTFSNAFSIYATFQQTNDIIKLQTPDGDENCYPFANTLGPVNGYPESNWPQCDIPISTDTTVCAYLYEDNSGFANESECRERKYQVITYDSAEDAIAAGAIVTHKGACGVCSNTQDLWARMKTLHTFETDSVVCATKYLFSATPETRFDDLKNCAIEAAGLTEECAKLWAHLGAATVAKCAGACPVDSQTGKVEYNGPPPECETSDCLECPTQYNEFFGAISGRTLQGSGITEPSARPCSEFYRVVHDPCIGAEATVSPAPTPMEGSSTTSSGEMMQQKNGLVVLLPALMASMVIVLGLESFF